MEDTKTGPVVDGDVKRTGAAQQIKPDRNVHPTNQPKPNVRPKPEQRARQ